MTTLLRILSTNETYICVIFEYCFLYSVRYAIKYYLPFALLIVKHFVHTSLVLAQPGHIAGQGGSGVQALPVMVRVTYEIFTVDQMRNYCEVVGTPLPPIPVLESQWKICDVF